MLTDDLWGQIYGRKPRQHPQAQTSWGVGAELQEEARVGSDLNSIIDNYRQASKPKHDRYYPDGGKMEGRDYGT
jgi:hypothetical protein